MVGSLGSTESDDTAQRLVSAVVRDPGAAASQYTLQWALLCTRHSVLYSVHTAVGSTRYCTRYSGLYMLLYTLRRALLCTRYSGLYAAHTTVGSTLLYALAVAKVLFKRGAGAYWPGGVCGVA